jgi:hypothetical protein
MTSSSHPRSRLVLLTSRRADLLVTIGNLLSDKHLSPQRSNTNPNMDDAMVRAAAIQERTDQLVGILRVLTDREKISVIDFVGKSPLYHFGLFGHHFFCFYSSRLLFSLTSPFIILPLTVFVSVPYYFFVCFFVGHIVNSLVFRVNSYVYPVRDVL